uniref:ATP synthase subunit a n=1 Tax=Allorhynchium sp. YN TaxID=2742724 RepID=A0A6M9ATF7_9HYME|nr:ATP synthase F0 subunit 6 [Allorhynchium sp. YN]QKK69211.1 ATP synthase F0 subunit 6 [Allorhynchium sp. YN]
MLLNLFSIFDPATSLNHWFELNWIFMIFIPLFMPYSFWFKKNKFFIFINLLLMFLFKEMNNLLKTKNYNNINFFLMIFFMILTFNFLGLFPYIFNPTSHLVISLTLSLPIWLGIMFYGWFNFSKHMLSHLIPLGTPSILMPFMVMIETISNIIRPSTLAIRLSANMVAGHLLLCLLGSTEENIINNYILFILLTIQMLLLTLEISVSIIQSYVFMTLSSLYSNEI